MRVPGLGFALTIWNRFAEDDGWPMASHMALSALMALFPFLIFVTALAGVVSTAQIQADIVGLVFETWPQVVAAPIADEVNKVLGSARPGVLTFGAVLAFLLATNGVEAVRVGINRAYRVEEHRPFWLCRMQDLLFVIVGALSLVVLAVFVVLWPVIWSTALRFLPHLEPNAILPELTSLAMLETIADAVRYAATAIVLLLALVLVHIFLAAGRRSLLDIWPGVLFTFAVWVAAGIGVGIYLSDFADYSRTYAGLGGVVAALFFLWMVSVVFLFGAEINAVLIDRRRRKDHERRRDRAKDSGADI